MYVSKVSPKSNLVPRVLSYPPPGARDRETGLSLSRSRGRVGENPGNEVAQKAVCTQQVHFWGALRTGLVFQNKSFRGGSDGPVERSISHSPPSKDGRFSNGGRGGGVRIFSSKKPTKFGRFGQIFKRRRHSFHLSSCRSSTFKKLLIIIIFIIIIIATTTTTTIIIIITIIHCRNQTKFHMV